MIDQQHDVGRLGRRCGAARAHCHSDVGSRKCGRVIDTVSNHHDAALLALGENEQDLLIGRQARTDAIETKPAGHTFGDIGAVAGGQEDPLDPLSAKPVEHSSDAVTQRVCHDQVSGHVSIDGDRNEHRSGSEGGPLARSSADASCHKVVASDQDFSTADRPDYALTWNLANF